MTNWGSRRVRFPLPKTARMLLVPLALTCVAWGAAECWAQRDRQRPPPQRPQRERGERPQRGDFPPPGGRPPHGDRPLPPPPDDAERPLLDRVFGAPSMHPDREDFGPLQPGEEEQMLDFARDRTPRLYGMLNELRRRSPARFRENLEERLLPRLRQIRRLCEDNPAIGARLIDHIENQQSMMRATFALRDRRLSDDERARVLNQVRGWEAANLRIEDAVMDDWIASLKAGRDDLLDRFIDLAQDPDANLAGEPEPLRTAIERLREVNDPEQRDVLLERVRDAVGRRIDDRIANMEERLARRRDNRDRELDERMRHYDRPGGGDHERPPHAGPRDRP